MEESDFDLILSPVSVFSSIISMPYPFCITPFDVAKIATIEPKSVMTRKVKKHITVSK